MVVKVRTGGGAASAVRVLISLSEEDKRLPEVSDANCVASATLGRF